MIEEPPVRRKELTLNSSQQKTLERIFENPVRSDLIWTEIESLFLALGGKIREGKGSRVRVFLNDVVATFHRPHPKKETDKGSLKSVRAFLIRAQEKSGNQP
ncbi:MAG: type II toxin-antitoxin system HicA family toxin [Syntrophobacteraceae bacterium]